MPDSPPDRFEVRPAVAADAAEIARVHVLSWRAAYRGLLSDRYLERLNTEERERTWRRRIDGTRADETVLVAERAGTIAGFASAGPTRDRDADPRAVGEVYAVYVVPEEWGRGAGRHLLEGALTALTEAGFEHAGLWVLESNTQARGFYEHLGWRADGTTKKERFGERVTEVRYRLTLRSSA
jgi:ribosomal protein S18 acetylase RimI-like enzyme